MRTHHLTPFLMLAILSTPARAQDAEKIIDQYIKAQGGSKLLSKVQTLTIEGTITNATVHTRSTPSSPIATTPNSSWATAT